MALSDVLTPIAGAAGTAGLQRTFLLQTQTPDGIPRLLIVLDTVNNEEPEFESEVSQHAVERGREVSDHIQPHNPKITLKGKISNTPLDLSVTIANLLSSGIQTITSSQARSNILNTGLQQAAGIVGAQLLGGTSNPKAAGLAGGADAIARTALLSAYENKAIFDVVTRRQRYTNMVISRLAFPRSADTGYALDYEIDMVALRIVSPLQVQITQLDESVISTASNPTNLGAQTSKEVSSATSGAVKGSWLRQLANGKFPAFFGGQ